MSGATFRTAALALVAVAVVAYFLLPAKGEAPAAVRAPGWTLKDPSGRTHCLADYRGQVLVLDFWATWCPPCRQAMPHVQRLHEQYKDRGVVVFGVNVADTGDPIRYMREKGFTYPLLLNGDAVAKRYQIVGIPTFVVIDRAGREVYRGSGFNKTMERQLTAAIEKALASFDS